MSEHLKVERDGGVLVVCLNRPEKKNALTDAMYDAFAGALEAAEHDKAVRAVLIRAEGDAFTGGNDIADFAQVASGARAPETLAVLKLLKALAAAEKPLVAAVKGAAVGVGTTLLLHCDLVFVAEDARLSAPFADLALTPEAAASLFLPLRIGHQRAFAMFALGQALDGRAAAAQGLANAVLPTAEVDAAALTAARAVAARPLGALIETKRLMRDAEAIWAVMQKEAQVFAGRLTTPEAREAFLAFAERRAPDFTGLGG